MKTTTLREFRFENGRDCAASVEVVDDALKVLREHVSKNSDVN